LGAEGREAVGNWEPIAVARASPGGGALVSLGAVE